MATSIHLMNRCTKRCWLTCMDGWMSNKPPTWPTNNDQTIQVERGKWYVIFDNRSRSYFFSSSSSTSKKFLSDCLLFKFYIQQRRRRQPNYSWSSSTTITNEKKHSWDERTKWRKTKIRPHREKYLKKIFSIRHQIILTKSRWWSFQEWFYFMNPKIDRSFDRDIWRSMRERKKIDTTIIIEKK